MHFPTFTSTILFLLGAVAYTDPAANAPIQVNLRIEGAKNTIFEGTVTTRGHDITTPSSGTHECDGLNQGANAQPGATSFSALADGAKQNGFTFDGTFASQFDDFIIGTIGSESSGGNTIWISGINFFQQDILTGCHQEINAGDDVVFALTDNPGSRIFLQLDGPTTAQVNQPVTLFVVDGLLFTRIQGAQVNAQTSDANGVVVITFTQPGVVSLHAGKDGFVRSSKLEIQITN